MISKGDQIFDFKTGNSQQSDIDLFSKLETSFLEKFFKYNLSDYFSEYFANIYEDIFERKIALKSEKALASSLFVANRQFHVDEVERKLESFYTGKSKSLSDGHLSYGFKKLYCNESGSQHIIKEDELILVDIKIKAQVQKIQEVPQKILKCLSSFKSPKKSNLSQLQTLFAEYTGQYINIFFIYFGDINFSIFNKKMYETDSIKLMGNTFRFRIFVFFVSKQGLIESFKTVNKIQNLEIINDLVIQFYELKRAKQREKKGRAAAKREKKEIKDNQREKEKGNVKEGIEMRNVALACVGVISLTIFGIAIKKMFF